MIKPTSYSDSYSELKGLCMGIVFGIGAFLISILIILIISFFQGEGK